MFAIDCSVAEMRAMMHHQEGGAKIRIQGYVSLHSLHIFEEQ